MEAAAGATPGGAPTRGRLLIVEDGPATRMALRDYFDGLGYDTDVAGDLATAEDCLAGRPYHLVLTDLRLGEGPDLDGLRVITLARRRHPSCGVIVLTALHSVTVEGTVIGRGADVVMRKPAPLPVVADAVSRLIETIG